LKKPRSEALRERFADSRAANHASVASRSSCSTAAKSLRRISGQHAGPPSPYRDALTWCIAAASSAPRWRDAVSTAVRGAAGGYVHAEAFEPIGESR